MNCHFCGEEMSPSDPTKWQAGSVFLRMKGAARSTRYVIVRRHEIFAHDWCVEKFKAGRLNQGQLDL